MSWERSFLDVRNRAIGYQLAYIGTLARAAVEPRGIFSAALLAYAAGIILFHNHPSGDPSPSAEDLAFTRRMAGRRRAPRHPRARSHRCGGAAGVRFVEAPRTVVGGQRGGGAPSCR
jgi:hypothetical protein